MARSDSVGATTPGSLTRSLRMELVGDLGDVEEVAAELRYDVRDPYAVRATFWSEGQAVAWDLSRDLLDGGCEEPTGDGDVHVWPSVGRDGRSVVVVELGSTEGWVMLQVDAREVIRFLAATHRLVLPGEESVHVDVDALIAAILTPVED